METENIDIRQNCAVITAHSAMFDDSHFTDVSMRNVTILDANLSDLKIDGAQVGGAHISNLGLPDENHPAYDPTQKQRPVHFESCDLNGSIFDNCDLSHVEITNCNVSGLKINGVLIELLLSESQETPDDKIGLE